MKGKNMSRRTLAQIIGGLSAITIATLIAPIVVEGGYRIVDRSRSVSKTAPVVEATPIIGEGGVVISDSCDVAARNKVRAKSRRKSRRATRYSDSCDVSVSVGVSATPSPASPPPPLDLNAPAPPPPNN